jgi:hypothetical protein
MNDMWARIAGNLVDRTTGPLHFRMFLQPTMAIVFAVIDGRKDARAGRTPYLWSLLSDAAHRATIARDGWKSIGKVFVLAAVLDGIYQYTVQRFIYPGELIIVALLLALLPYLILRGLVTRLMAAGRPGPRGRTDEIGAARPPR